MPTRTHLQSASEGESPLAGTRLVARLMAPANPPLTKTRTHTDTPTHTFRFLPPGNMARAGPGSGAGGRGWRRKNSHPLLYTFPLCPPPATWPGAGRHTLKGGLLPLSLPLVWERNFVVGIHHRSAHVATGSGPAVYRCVSYSDAAAPTRPVAVSFYAREWGCSGARDEDIR